MLRNISGWTNLTGYKEAGHLSLSGSEGAVCEVHQAGGGGGPPLRLRPCGHVTVVSKQSCCKHEALEHALCRQATSGLWGVRVGGGSRVAAHQGERLRCREEERVGGVHSQSESPKVLAVRCFPPDVSTNQKECLACHVGWVVFTGFLCVTLMDGT